MVYVFFHLVLLAVYSSYHQGRMRQSDLHSVARTNGMEIVLFVWILGFTFGEMQQVR